MVLTKKDLDAIRELIGITIDESLEKKLDKKLKNYPTKEDFFDKMDEVMSELKLIREENLVTSHQIKRNSTRIDKIENKLSIQAS